MTKHRGSRSKAAKNEAKESHRIMMASSRRLKNANAVVDKMLNDILHAVVVQPFDDDDKEMVTSPPKPVISSPSAILTKMYELPIPEHLLPEMISALEEIEQQGKAFAKAYKFNDAYVQFRKIHYYLKILYEEFVEKFEANDYYIEEEETREIIENKLIHVKLLAADVLYKSQDFEKSLRYCYSVLKMTNDKHSLAHIIASRCHLKEGQFKMAEFDLQQAKRYDSNNNGIPKLLQYVKDALEENDAIIAANSKAIKDGNADFETHFSRGKAYFAMNMLPLARKDFEQAMLIDNTDEELAEWIEKVEKAEDENMEDSVADSENENFDSSITEDISRQDS